VAITGNIIRNTDVGIALSITPGAGQALVHSNIIANTKTGGVIGFDHARQISGDLAVKNSSHHSVFSNSNR
jgi:hypothetical protein